MLETVDLAIFGTLVVAGPTPDHINVLIPDTVGPTVDAESPVNLQHVVGLSLGPATNLSLSLPLADLALLLCENSVVPTLGLGRRAYWDEVNPILRKWQSVNDARCPECARSIRVNMSRHIRLSHTVCQCFWKCPVPTCPMWFASELNGKDHLERIHSFTEGRGYSFCDCLRQFGLEWFGRRSFFDQREETGQALWMDLALARYSGQELHNNYVLTTSPAFGNLRKFFRAAVRDLVLAYSDFSVAPAAQPSICDRMRQEINETPQGTAQSSYVEPVVDITVVESLSPLIISSTTPPPVVDAPVRSLTPNNRSLSFMQSRSADRPQLHVPLSRGAVSSVSLGSSDLLYYVEPLPLGQMLYHDVRKQHVTNSWQLPSVMSPSCGRTWPK